MCVHTHFTEAFKIVNHSVMNIPGQFKFWVKLYYSLRQLLWTYLSNSLKLLYLHLRNIMDGKIFLYILVIKPLWKKLIVDSFLYDKRNSSLDKEICNFYKVMHMFQESIFNMYYIKMSLIICIKTKGQIKVILKRLFFLKIKLDFICVVFGLMVKYL